MDEVKSGYIVEQVYYTTEKGEAFKAIVLIFRELE